MRDDTRQLPANEVLRLRRDFLVERLAVRGSMATGRQPDSGDADSTVDPARPLSLQHESPAHYLEDRQGGPVGLATSALPAESPLNSMRRHTAADVRGAPHCA